MRWGRVRPRALALAATRLAATACGLALAARPGLAQAGPGTCVATVFQLAAVGPGALGLAMGTAGGPCWGPYVFEGVRPAALGFPAATTDDAPELARALAQWVPADGVPPVDQWVGLSPILAAAFRAAGIDPTRFLQWINEYDGAGTVGHPQAPPTWPPFLPRGLVADPTAALRVAADAAPPGGTGAPAGAGAPGAPAPLASTLGGTATPTPPAPRARANPPAAPGPPPEAASADGTLVPCAVIPACRRAVLAFDRFRDHPWYVRLALRAQRRAGPLLAVAAVAGLAAAAGRRVLVRRRHRLWYGRARGPD